jgi:small ligand-binding sensory domain FIST
MEWTTRIVQSKDLVEVVYELTRDLPGQFDLGFLFLSNYDDVFALSTYQGIQEKLFIKTLLGCCCYGVIADRKEIENTPAAVLLLATLPEVDISPFYHPAGSYDDLSKPEDWYDFLNVYPNEKPQFIIFSDPLNTSLSVFLEAITHAYPDAPAFGGLVAAGEQLKSSCLLYNGQSFSEGLVGVFLKGNIHIETIVAQGCRPMGENYIVTSADENIVYELAGKPFYEILEEVLEKVSKEDRKLAEQAIFLGVAMDEYKHRMRQGDYVIRLVMGIDEETGAGILTDAISQGQTVKFHVRDSQAAEKELETLLLNHKQELLRKKPKGAMIVSCSARGIDLFGALGHDTRLIRESIGKIPLAGFFGAGEIGPVHGKNFLHGLTTVLGLFYEEQCPFNK